MTDSIRLRHDGCLKARIVLPASKSISARALIINALSGNPSLPENLSDSDDTQAMLRALRTPPGVPVLDIGAAGTAMRFLTACLSVTPGERTLTGTERMRHRPIGILVDALRQLGADISYEGEEGFPPLHIVGREGLRGGSLAVAGNVSSQYVSALLMIAPTLKDGLRLTLTGEIASRPYLDMTLGMMRDFGAEAAWTAPDAIEVKGGTYLRLPYHVEGDWSAASYWYEMVALAQGEEDAEVELVGLHRESMQGDSKVSEWMAGLGVASQFLTEPDGTEVVRLRKQAGSITGCFCQDFTHQPDLAQTFAVTCAMLGVPFRLTGLQSLRIKETDRIAALTKELGKMVCVEERNGELLWEGFRSMGDLEAMCRRQTVFDTYDDHRMAMALAPVCLRTGEVRINCPQVVSKSYPAFWDDLGKAGFICDYL